MWYHASMAASKAPPEPAKSNSQPLRSAGERSFLGGCLLRLISLVFALGLLGGAAAAVGWFWLDATLPDVYGVQTYQQLARESSRVYAAGGEVVARFGEEIRTVVPAERMAPTMRVAMVCAEDAAFFSHPGLDLIGIGRAIWIDVTTGRYAQGASTITQQLAKTRFLTREKTVIRKLKELVLARKLEEQLSKDDILTLYLNEVYFGHGRYGVEEAARYFFGRSASELDLAQAALLAALVNSPSRLSPIRHPDRARARRKYVLEQMHKRGYIGEPDLQRALAEPLPTKPADEVQAAGDWYLEAVRREVLQHVDRQQLQTGGLRIEVAMDVGLQRAAEAAVQAGLQRLDDRYQSYKPLGHLKSEIDIAKTLRKLSEAQTDRRPGLPLQGVVRQWDADRKAWLVDVGEERGWLAQRDVARYAPPSADAGKGKGAGKAPPSEQPRLALSLQNGDVIKVSIRERTDKGVSLTAEFGPQAALVAIEPKTRLVRALVGGDNFDLHPFDRSRAYRQPGSTFKTFAYGAALDAGKLTPDTPFVDEKRSFRAGGKLWTPRNFSGKYDGKTYTARQALAHSINSIAVEVAHQVGPQAVVDFATKAGIESKLVPGLPIALGASSVTPLELTNAYATIASGGLLARPILVTRIVGRDGQTLYAAPRDQHQRAITEDLAKTLTDMLGEVVRQGSGKEAQKAGRQVAGKTGTSNGGRDVWFVGFCTELVATVWLGHDDRTPMEKASGGTLAVPIWTQFIRDGLHQVPPTPLPRLPAAVALLPVEDATAPEPVAAPLVDDDLLVEDEPPAAPAASEPLPPRRPPASSGKDPLAEPEDDATEASEGTGRPPAAP
jgi:penicillin-binding protein 1A